MTLLRRRGKKRSFHRTVAFPILARGVAVYTLWDRAPVFPEAFPRPPIEILQRPQKIGSWYAIQLVWKPTSSAEETPWIDTAETEQALALMLDYMDRLSAAQPTGEPQARPVFRLLHVRELQVRVPRFYRLRYRISKDALQQEVFYTRRAFVLALQRQYDLLADDTPEASLLASAYDHYDRALHSRGWIIINMARALLVGVSEKTVRILVNLIQRNDIEASQAGISLGHYEEVLGRLGIWNSSEEIGETVDLLGNMIANGNIAINGQVLLTLVLTLIGVVLSIYSIVQPQNWQVQLWISLGILFIASLFFWGYARFGARIWVLLGMLAIVATVLLDTAAFWFDRLIHLFALLHL